MAKVACAPKPDVQDSILAQVARQLESEIKRVQVENMPIQGIKLWVMKEFNIPCLNRDHSAYYLSKCKAANNKVDDNKENNNKANKLEPRPQPTASSTTHTHGSDHCYQCHFRYIRTYM